MGHHPGQKAGFCASRKGRTWFNTEQASGTILTNRDGSGLTQYGKAKSCLDSGRVRTWQIEGIRRRHHGCYVLKSNNDIRTKAQFDTDENRKNRPADYWPRSSGFVRRGGQESKTFKIRTAGSRRQWKLTFVSRINRIL